MLGLNKQENVNFFTNKLLFGFILWQYKYFDVILLQKLRAAR